MSVRSVRWLLAAVLCAPIAAQSGWIDYKGELVPEISPRKWINVDGDLPTRESLKGKVWLLKFFSTGSSESMKKVDDLSKLYDAYRDRGFRIVAISTDSSSRLKKEMIERRNVAYWVASDPWRGVMEGFTREGVLSYPRFYLVNAWGRVVGNDIPTGPQLEKLLEDVFVVDLEREMPAALEKAEQAYKSGAYGEAWKEAVEKTQAKEAIIQAEAGYLRDKVVEYAAFLKRTLPIAMQDDSPEQAYGRLMIIAAQFDGMELGSWAGQELKKRARNEAISRHRAAWRKLGRAIERDLAAGDKTYDRKRARKLYQDVIDKYALSGVPAMLAQKRIRRFDDLK